MSKSPSFSRSQQLPKWASDWALVGDRQSGGGQITFKPLPDVAHQFTEGSPPQSPCLAFLCQSARLVSLCQHLSILFWEGNSISERELQAFILPLSMRQQFWFSFYVSHISNSWRLTPVQSWKMKMVSGHHSSHGNDSILIAIVVTLGLTGRARNQYDYNKGNENDVLPALKSWRSHHYHRHCFEWHSHYDEGNENDIWPSLYS